MKKKKQGVPAAVKKQSFKAYMKGHYDLYLLLLPAILYTAVFLYIPMYGVLMAFQDYSPVKGIIGSNFVGLKHFKKFFSTYMAKQIISNTVILSGYSLLASFPFPVILALMLNYCVNRRFGKIVQTVTYMPYFISVMVLVGMMNIFFSTNYGVVNTVLQALGIEPFSFMSSEKSFRHMYVWSGIWQGMGYSSVIYFAALSGIDPTLYEAAMVDGAGKIKQTIHVTMPGIAPFIALMTIMSIGSVLNAGFDQIFNLYSPAVYATGDIIDTLVYRLGLINQQYSLSAAVGLLKSVESCILVLTGYKLADKYAGYKVW